MEKAKRKGFNFVVTLGARTSWNHRNRCIFIVSRSWPNAQNFFTEDIILWCMVGARKLQKLFVSHVG